MQRWRRTSARSSSEATPSATTTYSFLPPRYPAADETGYSILLAAHFLYRQSTAMWFDLT